MKETVPEFQEMRKEVLKDVAAERRARDKYRKAGIVVQLMPQEVEEGVRKEEENFRAALEQPYVPADRHARTAKELWRVGREKIFLKKYEPAHSAFLKLAINIHHPNRHKPEWEEELMAQIAEVKNFLNSPLLEEGLKLGGRARRSVIVSCFMLLEAFPLFQDQFPGDLEKEVRGVAVGILKLYEDNLKHIEQAINDDIAGGVSPSTAATPLLQLIDFGGRKSRQKAVAVLQNKEQEFVKHFGYVQESQRAGKSIRGQSCKDLWLYLSLFGTEDGKRLFKNYCRDLIQKDLDAADTEEAVDKFFLTDGSQIIDKIAILAYLKSEGAQKELEEIMQEFVVGVGLKSEQCISAWYASHQLFGQGINMPPFARNIKKIHFLEKWKPGSAKFLYENFNILDFDRYPLSVLQEMCERFEDGNIPYGILVVARDDHNGRLYGDKKVWKSVMSQLKDLGFTLRVMEVQGKRDMARSLLSLRARYPAQKVAFRITVGHGSKEGIVLGSGKDGYVSINDLEGKGVQRSRTEFFEDDAPEVLIACDTGEEGGIRDKAQEVLDTRVIAPATGGNLDSITILKYPDGKLFFDVEFNWAETVTHRDVRKA